MVRIVCWSIVTVLLLTVPVLAEGGKTTPAPVSDLIKQLDAEDFGERQAASTELTARGKDAVPALAEAAAGTNAEAATRAFEILRKHHESTDAELQAAAKEALQKMAEGDDATARRAKDVLTPKPMPAAVPPGLGGLRPGIRLAPGAFRIAVAGGGAAKRMSVKNVNGVKEIEVVEGDRTVKIDDDPAKGIKVKVTDKKDGKEETKDYEAKNAEELKEKHPAGHELYEKYAKGGAGEIHIEGLRVDFDAVPGKVRRIDPPAIVRDPRALVEQLNKAQTQLDEAAAKLKKVAEDPAQADSAKAALESIEAARKELEVVKDQFPLR